MPVAAEALAAAGRWGEPSPRSRSRPSVGPETTRTPDKPGFCTGGSDGRRSRDLTIFSRALYQLSYRAVGLPPWTRKPLR